MLRNLRTAFFRSLKVAKMVGVWKHTETPLKPLPWRLLLRYQQTNGTKRYLKVLSLAKTKTNEKFRKVMPEFENGRGRRCLKMEWTFKLKFHPTYCSVLLLFLFYTLGVFYTPTVKISRTPSSPVYPLASTLYSTQSFKKASFFLTIVLDLLQIKRTTALYLFFPFDSTYWTNFTNLESSCQYPRTHKHLLVSFRVYLWRTVMCHLIKMTIHPRQLWKPLLFVLSLPQYRCSSRNYARRSDIMSNPPPNVTFFVNNDHIVGFSTTFLYKKWYHGPKMESGFAYLISLDFPKLSYLDTSSIATGQASSVN